MKPYLKEHPWSIIEDSFDKDYHQISESVFSIGNGHMGQRANFEETYSGESLQGSYMAGVYYPDKTRVGWWKNGYPEYFAKVLNATNWIGLSFTIDGEELDLFKADVKSFYRELNMKEGYLTRTFKAELSGNRLVEVEATRFVSIVNKEIGAIEYKLTPVNFSGSVSICSYLDGDIKNEDANYDEKFWDPVQVSAEDERTSVTVKTKKLDFYYCAMQETHVYQGETRYSGPLSNEEQEKYTAVSFELDLHEKSPITVYKYAANVTNRDHDIPDLEKAAAHSLDQALHKGFVRLKKEQAEQWGKKWLDSDVVIEGDVAAQQGIRFNIFQLNQTYTGEDERLNIGPKGFTGEKYGGSTYWDTEAYCLPFYLATSEQRIPRNLLIYRYNHLEKAKENAAKLGFTKGALYPMVTMNGEESHNEWEITFEEIHRNGAIAYAIYNYVNYTGDKSYLGEYGIEVLTEISRFWEDRVHYVESKGYVMIGVTGPNEYENNVHNNWYTNRIASWTLEYTLYVLDYLKDADPDLYQKWVEKLSITEEETSKWADIIHRMYYPYDEGRGVFLQQDLFLDKELLAVEDLDDRHLPINQNWSWDRILRSCFIKQADVLQGLYFLNNEFDMETKKRNFDFYEPMTVHESSLSPCVHAILACELGYKEKAYEMYLRTARLDLDNYNNDTEDGCHITSMAGTWMSVVEGFGGMKIRNDQLILNPFIPGNWTSYSFKIVFRQARLLVRIDQMQIDVTNETDYAVDAVVHGDEYRIEGKSSISLKH